MRPQAQILAIGSAQAGGLIHFKISQQILHGQGFEVGVGKAEGLGNLLILFRQQTASGIHQTTTDLEQTCSTCQDGRLLDCEFSHRLR